MPALTVWVAADPADPTLAVLDELPPDVRLVIADSADRFAAVVDELPPDVLLFCKPDPALFQAMWRLAPPGSVRWVHSRFAGVDHVLFPALVESDVPLTAGRGLF